MSPKKNARAKTTSKKAARRKPARAKRPAAKRVSAVPKGFSTITPHLVVEGAARAVELYKRVLGAKVRAMMPMPDGRLMHVELQIGGSRLMLADDIPEMRGGVHRAPTRLGETSVTIHLYVPNADAVVEKAAVSGFTVEMPVTDMFWGDRYGQVRDPFGHVWSVATHKVDMTPKQMEKAAAAAMAAMGPSE
jgi:PhnB protein